MTLLAESLATDITQEQGLVVRHDGDLFVVRTSSGDYRARRATSCLVEPEEGDLALVASTPRGTSYVLAILERSGSQPTRLVAEGDLEVATPRGELRLRGAEGVSVLSAKALELVAGSVSMKALQASVVAEDLALVGRHVRAELDRVKAFATSVDSVFERLSQRVKRSYRFIEEADHVRAERIDYTASRTLNLHGENAVVTAAEVVKVDGAQILVG
ncbi:MAG: DUF3540 domain-containing protein [Deltaproteobacteria bacterium]|nr:DUF3540 domain-containing protein [Deltaproteobacteria bacterium]